LLAGVAVDALGAGRTGHSGDEERVVFEVAVAAGPEHDARAPSRYGTTSGEVGAGAPDVDAVADLRLVRVGLVADLALVEDGVRSQPLGSGAMADLEVPRVPGDRHASSLGR